MYSDKNHYTQLLQELYYQAKPTIIKHVLNSYIKIDQLKSRLLDTTTFCDSLEVQGNLSHWSGIVI